MTDETTGEADFPLTRRALAQTEATGLAIAFWWRDDDARRPTTALDRLLELRERYAAPLVLAVIPEGVQPALARRIADERDVHIVLHGWSHKNHAPPERKRAEFGDDRPAEAMRADLVAGRDRLQALFPYRWKPVFVPPWNRIGTDAAAMLDGLGLRTLSAYGQPARPGRLDTHCDLLDWRPPRAADPREFDGRLARQIAMRLPCKEDTGEPAQAARDPIGLLTHHLQHDEAAWHLLERLLALLSGHPAVRWPGADDLFAGGAGRSGANSTFESRSMSDSHRMSESNQ